MNYTAAMSVGNTFLGISAAYTTIVLAFPQYYKGNCVSSNQPPEFVNRAKRVSHYSGW